jgi:GT2 family glycosyltransferase
MPESPAGTIVMATHNRADRTIATVERLLDLPDGWPVVVVDDASTDHTSERLREHFGHRIHVITLDRNLGGAARNRGVEFAASPLVAFADDDSWWASGSLTAAAECFVADGNLGLLAATVVIEPTQRIDPIVAQFAGSPLATTAIGPSVLGFLACGAVVRRRAFLEAGGFHPLLHVGGEEALLALDLRAAGWTLAHVPEVQAHHAPAPDEAGRAGREVRMSTNRVLVALMRRPPTRVWHELRWLAGRAASEPAARRALWRVVVNVVPALRSRRRLPDAVETEARLLDQSP